MLKEYLIKDLFPVSSIQTQYYVGTFEGTEDADLEWPHRHSFYSFVWFTEGEGSYVVDFIEYEIKPQRVFLVNPKQVHNWDYLDSCKGFIIVIDSFAAREMQLHFKHPFIDINQSDDSLLYSILCDLIAHYDVKHFSDHAKLGILYFYSLICCASGDCATLYNNHPVLEEFRTLILEEGSQLESIDSYAQLLDVSVDELNHFCKQYYEKSAKQFLLDLKVTEAKRLLLFSNLHIAEITFRLGFEDSSYFARIFKKKTSYSPTEFQKKYRK